MRWRVLHLLALSTMAITQPLLSILGDNPTFFTAHRSSAGQIIWFALLIALGPTAVLAATELLTHRLRPELGLRLHFGVLAVLTYVFLIQVVDVIPGHWAMVATLAGALTVGAIELYARFEPVRTVVSVLAITPALFVGLFLFVSPTSAIVLANDITAVDFEDLVGAEFAEATDDDGSRQSRRQLLNTRFPSIYMLVLDELPMASLLDGNGRVDAARWPNFARLASTSHLFSNATTVGFTTERAVPAILASTSESRPAPVYSLYPDNLFTLLGDIYDVSSSDPLVDLCPPSVCNGAVPDAVVDFLRADRATPPSTTMTASAPASTNPLGSGGSLTSLLDDATIVFGHLATPDGFDIGLPSIGATWGNFGGDLGVGGRVPAEANATSVDPADAAAPVPELRAMDPDPGAPVVDVEAVNQNNTDFLDSLVTNDTRVADFRTEVAAIESGNVPRLHYLHTLIPHVPWRLHANGETYADIGLPGYFSMWDSDIDKARAGQQRHLLQLRFADELLGEYLDRLEAEGVFDDSTVIVTADHGISFLPGYRSRGLGDANLGGIAGVPIFYKEPAQTEPVRHNTPVETIDIVATIAAQLEIDAPWEFDGHDLFGPEIKRVRAVLHPFAVDIPEPFEPMVLAVADELHATFDSGANGNLYALAGLAGRIGKPVVDLVVAPSALCWSRERPLSIPEADGATGYVFGQIAAASHEPIEFAIVIGGVLTGTARTLDDGVPHRIFAFGDPQYWAGASVEALAIHEIVDETLAPMSTC